MLKTSITTNTWQCDGLNCPTPEQISASNPFYKVNIIPGPPLDSCEVDLCDVCIQTITAPLAVAFIQSLPG